jgi:predicted nucleotidyltransferase
MDLRAVLKDLAEAFATERIPYALIGGLALAPYGAGRATVDLDFLVEGDRAEDIDRIMQARGYRSLHRTADLANYLSDEGERGRVDYLFARREPSRAMLRRARPFTVIGRLDVRVVDAEDLIGLKVQAAANNPRRRRAELVDIRRVLEASPEVDLRRVREYFALFEMEDELDQLLSEVQGT